LGLLKPFLGQSFVKVRSVRCEGLLKELSLLLPLRDLGLPKSFRALQILLPQVLNFLQSNFGGFLNPFLRKNFFLRWGRFKALLEELLFTGEAPGKKMCGHGFKEPSLRVGNFRTFGP